MLLTEPLQSMNANIVEHGVFKCISIHLHGATLIRLELQLRQLLQKTTELHRMQFVNATYSLLVRGVHELITWCNSVGMIIYSFPLYERNPVIRPSHSAHRVRSVMAIPSRTNENGFVGQQIVMRPAVNIFWR